ncbi:MAG TPA: type II toxin-antitoxin system RelE/ParE family toxin [Saprospiraceae bacterium]|nr:type II toxin-antitoxin system RelE/ParE family toxin [Saprospiraceae bacterium]MBK6666183.1 type II toxin-antitoxin system RelE/ParE family toxin [Saprospiraceae bacterium]MBK7698569.1 type II toxin-antitoxin system RelE/ParE family toxin [Saprospiraceae bacterium]MBK8825877.1 type II toxin-antitoxin system RelE/ParE family toxin [Saprospiraceae bacterium]MBK8888192.1 type II toxin-antitoxin system RelE/ParE family toxin [Saprospiraceae bacterium]
MIIEFDKSFEKSLEKIKSKSVFEKIEKIILTFESLTSIDKMPNVKKLSGFNNYYRIRMGDYRIGVEALDGNVVRFILIAHRKDIYKYFP